MRLSAATLTLLLLGCPDAEVRSVGSPTDAAAPITVTITAPQDGQLVGAIALVEGQVTSTSVTEVEINGQRVPATAGVFAHWVPLSVEDNTILVTHPDSGASDSVTVAVDPLPPSLELKGPPRGTSVSGADQVQLAFTCFDESGLVRVTAAGQNLEPTDGEWSLFVPLIEGMNTLRIEAEDAAGNLATEHISVLNGQFEEESSVMRDAVVMHLGPTALRAFNPLVGGLVDTLDYDSLAQGLNPLFDSDLFTVNILSVGLQPGTQVVILTAPDHILVKLTVEGLSASTELHLHSGSKPTYGVALDIDRVLIDMPLTVKASDGSYNVELLEPTFQFEHPSLTITDSEGETPATAGLEGPILDSLETLLSDTALALGIQTVQVMLDNLTTPFEYELAGVPVAINLAAFDADVGSHGLELRLDGNLKVTGDTLVEDDPGVLRTADPEPYHPRSQDIIVAVNDDLLHTLGHAVWRTGNLRFTVDQALIDSLKAPLELVAGFLGGVAESAGVDPESPLVVDISTTFPPVSTDVPGSDATGIALGDAVVDFLSAGESIIKATISMRFAAGGVDTEGALHLELAPYDTGFELDSADPVVERQVEGATEPFVQALLGELAPLFSSLVGAIPIPVFGPVVPIGLSVGDDGTAGRWIVISGLLVPTPQEETE